MDIEITEEAKEFLYNELEMEMESFDGTRKEFYNNFNQRLNDFLLLTIHSRYKLFIKLKELQTEREQNSKE